MIQYKALRSVFFVIYIIRRYLCEVILHYKAQEEKIDPGPVVPKSDTLTTRTRSQTDAASNNSAYWTDNPSIGHIRIRIQGKNFDFFTSLMSPVLFICVVKLIGLDAKKGE